MSDVEIPDESVVAFVRGHDANPHPSQAWMDLDDDRPFDHRRSVAGEYFRCSPFGEVEMFDGHEPVGVDLVEDLVDLVVGEPFDGEEFFASAGHDGGFAVPAVDPCGEFLDDGSGVVVWVAWGEEDRLVGHGVRVRRCVQPDQGRQALEAGHA